MSKRDARRRRQNRDARAREFDRLPADMKRGRVRPGSQNANKTVGKEWKGK